MGISENLLGKQHANAALALIFAYDFFNLFSCLPSLYKFIFRVFFFFFFFFFFWPSYHGGSAGYLAILWILMTGVSLSSLLWTLVRRCEWDGIRGCL